MSDKPLTLGMVGENVAALHQALSERGFAIAEAETQKQFFGPATRMAVGDFQKTHGIDPSCEVCMATAAKLGTTLIASDAANDNQPPVQTFFVQVGPAANYSQPQGQVLTAQVGSAANESQPQGQVEYLQVGNANYNQPQGQTFSSQVGTRQQPIQDSSKRKMPTHLSVFALSKSTGHPIARMPFYAEVGVVSVSALPQPKCNLKEAIRIGIKDFITLDSYSVSFKPAIRQVSDKLVEPLCGALYRLLAPAIIDRWVEDQVSAAGAIAGIIQIASDLAKARSMDWNNPQMLGQLLEEAILAYAKENKLPLAEANAQGARIVWAHPLGVLATDHVGYLSFDLTRLPQDVADAVALALEARRRDPNTPTATSIWIYPMAKEESRVDALEQMRFADDAIIVKLGLDVELDPDLCQPKLCESIKNLGIMAMQNPNLTDWRLSPGSFATNPSTLVGDDGCENLFPAQIALQEFTIRQVVRLTDTPPGITVPKDYKMAYIDEYKVTWHSLGHSLGEILYSLPLAPGESVKLAVIDWSWDSFTRRDEQTQLTEEVLHQTHRDRTITETVKAGLKEMQHGSSFMGGVATSAGAAGGYAGMGGAIGNAWSLGGSTATSEGSRDLVGENIQRLSDSFSQASSSQRELNSTVVIQARQEEKESIQTRTFSNYNHSHTLTMLYYEVLRHFKVMVEWVRRRPALLAKVPKLIEKFDAATLVKHRFLLEPALLDPSLKPGFNSLEKQEMLREYQTTQGITPSDDWVAQPWEGDMEFSMFEFGIDTRNSAEVSGDDTTDSPVVVYVVTADLNTPWDSKRYELQFVYKGDMKLNDDGNAPHNLNSGQRFNEDGYQWFFTKIWDGGANDGKGAYVSVKWKEIVGFQFEKWGDDDWRIDHLAINGFGANGWWKSLTEGIRDVDLYFLSDEPSPNSFTWILRPGSPPTPLPPPHRMPEKSLAAEEIYLIKKLVDHFDLNKNYYNRVILLNTDPATIAMEFEEDSTGWLTDNADPYPLEISGSYVAYPMAKVPGQLVVNSERSERLMTLPTRGVFAEGKLGHCNISEEIDNTRFWKWEEHPIPFEAPGINPATPITPQPQQTNIAPTPFPQSLVNIVNPSPAPDPTGLASAMNVLATSNIFRDMSGRAEVADLLKKLSDNSVAIASVAQKAATGGAGGSSGGGGGSSGSGSGGASEPPATGGGTGTGQSSEPSAAFGQEPSTVPPQQTPEQRASQQIDNYQKALQTSRDYLPPDQQAQVRDGVTQDLANIGSLFENVDVRQPLTADEIPLEMVSYSRGAAISYAKRFWDRVCQDGFVALGSTPWFRSVQGGVFEHVGNPNDPERLKDSAGNIAATWKEMDDCTHFLSSCLGYTGGGLPIKREFPKGPYGILSAQRLVDYLITQKKYAIFKAEKVTSDHTSELQPGDIIGYYRKSKSRYTHLAMYAGNGDIYCHTYSRSPTCAWDHRWDIHAGDPDFLWSFIAITRPEVTPSINL